MVTKAVEKILSEAAYLSPFKVLHAARVAGLKDVVVISLLKDGSLHVAGSSGAKISEKLMKDALKVVRP